MDVSEIWGVMNEEKILVFGKLINLFVAKKRKE